jgi:hypothetical protein
VNGIGPAWIGRTIARLMLGLFCGHAEPDGESPLDQLARANAQLKRANAQLSRAQHQLDNASWSYVARAVTSNGTTMLRNDGGGGSFQGIVHYHPYLPPGQGIIAGPAVPIPLPHNDDAAAGLAHLSGSGSLTAVARAMKMTW